MEPEILSLSSQVPATGTEPEPDVFIPHSRALLLKMQFNDILQSAHASC
jgi:hypothetical protein